MTDYPCSGCGLRFCDGRCFQGECYLESGGETDDTPPARKPFAPDPQYIAWLAEIDAKRAELMALRDADGSLGDPMKDCEPRKAA